MTEAMRAVATGLGLPVQDAQLLQLTNNAVFALPRAGIVIRIARTHNLRDRVTKVIGLAHWFAEIDAPTIRLAPNVDRQVVVGGMSASVWRYVPPQPPAPTVEDLGLVLRELHTLALPRFPLPVWDPVGDARRRLADAEGLDSRDRDFLIEWCDRLDAPITALNGTTDRKLIHGDAHVGNLLREPSGRAVMCDFDATCLGPWQVDLVAVAVGEARFGSSGLHRALADAYGFDVTADPCWPILRDARELKMIAAAVPLLATSAHVAAEFAKRLQSVRDHDHDLRWTPFVDLTRPGRDTGMA
ncbi:phosphotransferase [Micromonospora sp. NPDC092111]|uniref:phosphotransferase n=1 Tax=Micromonospora sp. NPDC092111 TaxID=3364289 RepID=UPI00380B1DEC